MQIQDMFSKTKILELDTYPNNPKATTLSWSIILAPAIFCKVIFPSEAIIQLKMNQKIILSHYGTKQDMGSSKR